MELWKLAELVTKGRSRKNSKKARRTDGHLVYNIKR